MAYNIHPIFVHFPIALLLIYSLIKVIPFDKYLPKISWRQIETFLLLLGVAGAIVATSTGEIAQDLIVRNKELVEIHSTYAEISTFIFALLLLGEVLYFLMPIIVLRFKESIFTSILVYIQKILTNPILSKLLAILGFISISITGLLGGAIVYGTSADPFTGIVLRILGINL